MNENNEKQIVYATVVKTIDEYKVAINKGSSDGIKLDQKFLIFSLSAEEIIDPETKESLGKLEIAKGTGIVSHVQDKLATVTSNKRSNPVKIKRRNILLFSNVEEVVEAGDLLPFEDVCVGDKAKPI